ncbi:copper-binding protein [Phaeobacter gallaeciensis]|uniref:Copper-binding protein n=1 Tax=Phaeobacter gallaeciensis TaxID=60890 RepID=A0A366X8E0_9RHOB|nr:MULTISPECIES: copper chaperone PCu(A)C [Roseobacteraceae]MBT8168275.1 copper chaperone PCu(A)C [Falsiruegeria litorea]RBW61502.1 copper-binding protein [Phaeobacter gallaeciensis]
MSFKSILFTAVATLGLTTSAFAADVMVKDAYARSAGKNAKTGAAFMMIMNHGAENDRLINATSDVAKRVELHTHKENGDGVMQMLHVEEGFAIPAGEMHPLKRGGDHVMFMGLNQPFVQGEMIPVTLVFEKAGEVKVEIPVDLERKPAEGGMSHGTHKN